MYDEQGTVDEDSNCVRSQDWVWVTYWRLRFKKISLALAGVAQWIESWLMD